MRKIHFLILVSLVSACTPIIVRKPMDGEPGRASYMGNVSSITHWRAENRIEKACGKDPYSIIDESYTRDSDRYVVNGRMDGDRFYGGARPVPTYRTEILFVCGETKPESEKILR